MLKSVSGSTGGGGGTTTPGGANTQIQFNDSGAFGAGAALAWDKTTNTLTLGSAATPAIIATPAGSASNGADLTITLGAGIGSNKRGGNFVINGGVGTGNASGSSILLTAGNGATAPFDGNVVLSAGGGGVTNAITHGTVGFSVTHQSNSTTDLLIFPGTSDLVFQSTPGSFEGYSMDFYVSNLAAVDGAAANINANNNNGANTILFKTSHQNTASPLTNGPSATDQGGVYSDTNSWFLLGSNTNANIGIDGSNNVVSQFGSTATTDTNGFFYLRKVAGTPTGVPANTTGTYGNSIPIQYDATNNKLYVYNGGWKGIVLV